MLFSAIRIEIKINNKNVFFIIPPTENKTFKSKIKSSLIYKTKKPPSKRWRLFYKTNERLNLDQFIY